MTTIRAVATALYPTDWLDNETLHSICARHVLLNGLHTLRETVKALFTTKLGKIDCHFQGHLDSFVARAKGALGSVDDIVLKHTVLSNYLPFMSEASARSLVQTLRVPGPYQTANTFLKELSHPYPKQRHLRLCDMCVSEDETVRGFAHWRRDHQLPGVYRCPKHRTALRQLFVKNALHGTVVQMPQSDCSYRERLTVPVPKQDDSQEAALLAMAQIAIAISTLPAFTRFAPEKLHGMYRARLEALGLLVGGRVLRDAADLEILRFAGALDGLAEAPQWLSSSVRKDGLITRMASPSPPFARPLLHTIFIAWLFGSWQEFLAMYAAIQPDTESTPAGENAAERAARKVEFLALVQAGMKATEASRRTETNRYTGNTWAAAAGMTRGRGVTTNSVPTFIEHARNVHQTQKRERKQNRVTIRLPLARDSWLEALQRCRRGDMGATRIVAKDGTYLKTYDRAAYDAMKAAHPQTPRPVRKLHSLNELDGPLSVAVEEAADLLRSENPNRLIGAWDIVRVLETRGVLSMDCERLLMPLAKAALKKAVKTPHIACGGR